MTTTTVTYQFKSYGSDGWSPWVGVYTTEKEIRRKLRDILDEGIWKASEIRLVKITTIQTVEVLP